MGVSGFGHYLGHNLLTLVVFNHISHFLEELLIGRSPLCLSLALFSVYCGNFKAFSFLLDSGSQTCDHGSLKPCGLFALNTSYSGERMT